MKMKWRNKNLIGIVLSLFVLFVFLWLYPIDSLYVEIPEGTYIFSPVDPKLPQTIEEFKGFMIILACNFIVVSLVMFLAPKEKKYKNEIENDV